jgi:uncharacterized repeat protein (TIGR02543 family)
MDIDWWIQQAKFTNTDIWNIQTNKMPTLKNVGGNQNPSAYMTVNKNWDNKEFENLITTTPKPVASYKQTSFEAEDGIDIFKQTNSQRREYTLPKGYQFTNIRINGVPVANSRVLWLSSKWDVKVRAGMEHVKYNANILNATGTSTHYYNDKVSIKASNKVGYTFNGWTSNNQSVTNQLKGKGINATFTMPDSNITVTANYKKNIVPVNVKVTKVYSPITKFSVKKNKKVKIKYAILYSNNTIKQKTKTVKYNKTGKKTLTLKYQNKKLKLTIRVLNKTVKPKTNAKVTVTKANGLYFLKVKGKINAYYKFPKFSKVTGSPLYKWGIYFKSANNKKITVKWYGKALKKKI